MIDTYEKMMQWNLDFIKEFYPDIYENIKNEEHEDLDLEKKETKSIDS